MYTFSSKLKIFSIALVRFWSPYTEVFIGCSCAVYLNTPFLILTDPAFSISAWDRYFQYRLTPTREPSAPGHTNKDLQDESRNSAIFLQVKKTELVEAKVEDDDDGRVMTHNPGLAKVAAISISAQIFALKKSLWTFLGSFLAEKAERKKRHLIFLSPFSLVRSRFLCPELLRCSESKEKSFVKPS